MALCGMVLEKWQFGKVETRVKSQKLSGFICKRVPSDRHRSEGGRE